MKYIIFLTTFIIFTNFQYRTIYKVVYAGAYITVPENESWELDRVFINDGDTYSIKVSNAHFKKNYFGGDTIKAPYYISEMELLTKKDFIHYQIYFNKR